MSNQVQVCQTLELDDSEEPLCPELEVWAQDYGYEYQIGHPFFTCFIDDLDHCALVNEMFKNKAAAVAKARLDRDWNLYLCLHKRAGVFLAFEEIMDELGDVEYWRTLAGLYREWGRYFEGRLWPRLFGSARPHREAMMSRGQRQALSQMPGRIAIYRGAETAEGLNGWSWSLDPEHAEWQGTVCEDLGSIATGTVAKRDVIAYLGSLEKEILVNPEHVNVLSTDVR